LTNQQQYTWSKKDCHKGNSVIYQEPNGGTLFIGGWNQEASFTPKTHVIDLTGNEKKYWDIATPHDPVSEQFIQFTRQPYAGWLELPFPDYGIPKSVVTLEQWTGYAMVIREILQRGNDVLVACHGGHGRSGLFCSIVGYILGHETNPDWRSPVEHVRKIHCAEAVETLEQERFVYSVLGLRIEIKRVYHASTDPFDNLPTVTAVMACPICGVQSAFTPTHGMCMGCTQKYNGKAPIRTDLSLLDIKERGFVEHKCSNPKCIGIWQASVCGHVVHDMIVYEGYCSFCATQNEKEHKHNVEPGEGCAICLDVTSYSRDFGVCYECAEYLSTHGEVDEVHNSITDPYRAVVHTCDDEILCVGVLIADVCKHVIHDREVEDGLCPKCLERKNNKEAK
jgi:hypothetical protein